MNGTTTWLAADPVVERVELADRSWVDVVRGLIPAAMFREEWHSAQCVSASTR